MRWARDELMQIVELSPHPDPALLLAYIRIPQRFTRTHRLWAEPGQ